MKKLLLAAITALTLGVGSASAYADWGTDHQPAWDHTRAAQPGDYNN